MKRQGELSPALQSLLQAHSQIGVSLSLSEQECRALLRCCKRAGEASLSPQEKRMETNAKQKLLGAIYSQFSRRGIDFSEKGSHS